MSAGPLRALTVESLTEMLHDSKTDVTKQKLTEIDFSGENFQLETIENITIIGHHNPKDRDRIKEFNLGNNHLTTLLPLAIDNGMKAFKRMEVLDASNNLVVYLCAGYKGNSKFNEWPYKMESLVELKMPFNRLETIPNLQSMPNLKRLDLAHNMISPPWRNLRYGGHLQAIALNNNSIDWTKKEFIKELLVLEHLPELRTITLMENPFCLLIQDYKLHLLKAIIDVQKSSKFKLAKDKLEYIDGTKVSPQLRKQAEDVAPLLGSETQKIEQFVPKQEVDDGVDIESKRMPGIADMILLLGQAFSNPTGCIVIVHKLMDQARTIKEMRLSHPRLFQGALSEQDLKKQDEKAMALKLRVVNEFLQQTVLLMQRQPQLVPSLLRVLANLAGVMEGRLGERCLEALQDVMSAGDGYKDTVVEVMNECVIPQLKQSNAVADEDKVFRDTLTRGMNKLARKTGMGECLSGLVDSLVVWMGQDPSDDVVSMCAVASNHSKNAQNMGSEPKMLACIIEELKPEKCQPDSTKFYRLIKTAENIGKFDAVTVNDKTVYRSAQMLVRLGLHETVTETLKELLSMKSNLTEEQNIRIAALVDCLDAIAHCKEGLKDLLSQTSGYLKVLIRIYHVSRQGSMRIRPLLLTSVFRALLTIMSSPTEWFPFQWGSTYRVDIDSIEKEVTDGFQNGLPLLGYINQEDPSYRAMCIEAGQGAVLHSKPLKLKNLTSTEMHDLFVASINLIAHYCAMASTRAVPEKVASLMNENNREKYLFDCLECPSDIVRKAVVGCLYHVPLAELDEEEVSRLVNMLSETTNISAGETEIVLGESFSLLTKLALSRQETGRMFRERQAELAIHAALDILERNMVRDTRGDESEDAEKYTLSHSCVRYLVACSLWRPEDEEGNTLRRHLRNRDVMESIGHVLRAEDEFSDQYRLVPHDPSHIPRIDYRPVMIEMTWAGRTVEYLLQTFIGDNPLSPTGVVAPRIMRRMADVLLGVPDPFLVDVQAVYAAAGDTGERAGDRLKHDDMDDIDNIDDDLGDKDSDEDHDEDEANDSLTGFSPDETKSIIIDESLASFFRNSSLTYADMSEANVLNLERNAVNGEGMMPPYWLCDSSTCQPGVILETEDERNERFQQHQVFVYYRGLQRILFFIAQRQTNEEEKMNGVYEDAFAPSEIISECSEQLLRFRSIIKQKLEEELSKATSIGKAAAEHGASNLNTDAEGADRVGRQSDIGGRQLLLHAFMMEGAASKDPEQQNQFMSGAGEPKESERTSLVAASLRVIFALLNYGTRKSRAAAIEILFDNDRIRLLANVTTGPRSMPMWFSMGIGAKFMAVVAETTRIDYIERSAPTTALPAYDLVCRYATSVITTLVGRLERESTLSEADELLAMHTAIACGTIAEQIPHVIKPGQGSMEEIMEKKMTEFLYSRLFPRSLLKSLIKLLLYDMQASSATPSADANLEQLKGRALVRQRMRNAVTSVVVEFLRNSEQHRFEVLEQFTREEVENQQESRQSYLQDLLSEVNRRVYRTALQKYIHEQGYFDLGKCIKASGMGLIEFGIVGKMSSERIIEAQWVQVFDNGTFTSQLVVLSNFQMYILNEPSLVFGPCKECSADKFCPEGPVLDRKIKYYDIDRIVLGVDKQRIHLCVHKGQKKEGPTNTVDVYEELLFVMPKLGTGERFQKCLMELTSSMTMDSNPRLATIDPGILKATKKIPTFEPDMATKHGLTELLRDCQELQVGEMMRPGMIKLISSVDLYSEGGAHVGRRVILLTEKTFVVCLEDLTKWDFPRYWKDESVQKEDYWRARRKEIDAAEGSKEKKLGLALKLQKEKREWANKQTKLRSEFIAKHAQMYKKDQCSRQSGGYSDSVHNVETLSEICFSRGPLPACFLGFEKKQGSSNRVLWQDSENKDQKILSRSDMMYVIMFPDDSSREKWRVALGSQLANMGTEKTKGK
jgi:hypothetical protein